MRDDLNEAIESARSAGTDQSRREHSRRKIMTILLAVLRELPDDMSVREIREELEN